MVREVLGNNRLEHICALNYVFLVANLIPVLSPDDTNNYYYHRASCQLLIIVLSLSSFKNSRHACSSSSSRSNAYNDFAIFQLTDFCTSTQLIFVIWKQSYQYL